MSSIFISDILNIVQELIDQEMYRRVLSVIGTLKSYVAI